MDLEGDPVPPKLFLAPAKDGGDHPGDDGVGGGAVASPSASPPSGLAGRRCMLQRQSKGREMAAYTAALIVF
jgi:hypothetical protein